MNYEDFQPDLATRLAANAFLTNIPTIKEADPEATAKEHAKIEATWEAALAAQGLCITVMAPYATKLDHKKGGAMALQVHCPIVLAESVETNRSSTGLQLNAQRCIRSIVAELLGVYEFDAMPIGRPDLGEGLAIYYVQATARTVIRKGETA